jgi:hypothetical protein
MSKLTPENEKLLRSYKSITKALALSPNSREYFEFKKMMTDDELTVLRWLKKEVSHQNHLTNKINGTVSTTNRGRKKKEQTVAPVTGPTDAPVTEPTTDARVAEPTDARVTEPTDARVTEPTDVSVAEPTAASNELLENQLQ